MLESRLKLGERLFDSHRIDLEDRGLRDDIQANRNEEARVHDRAKVTRLLTSPSGHEVVGVETVIEEETHVFSSSVVIVACGAIKSAALLLRSAKDRDYAMR